MAKRYPEKCAVKMAGEEKNMSVFIAYGSNLLAGPVTASQAFDQLVKNLQTRGLIVRDVSRLWSSKSWPNPSDPSYVNAVLKIGTDLQPTDLMMLLHDMEREAGRVRDGRQNAPRVLDLDLISYDDVVCNDKNGLVLPHPRAAERAFVMGPMTDIAPEWVHPVLRQTAVDLYRTTTIGTDAHPLEAASS